MSGSRSLVEECVDYNRNANQVLSSIQFNLAKVRDMNEAIAQATQEQEHVSNNVAANISHINEVANASAQDASSMAEKSEFLIELATEISLKMGSFRTSSKN